MVVGRDRVLVVGASSGIGAATAAYFVAAGAEVTVVDVKPPNDSGLQFVHCDLADPTSIDAALKTVGGGWATVAHVAGIPGTADPETVLAVNFLGMRKFVKGVLPVIDHGGSLVVVASTAGSGWSFRTEVNAGLLASDTFEEGAAWYATNRDDYPAYNLSKEAAIVFVKQLSSSAWSQHGVRVNSVSPGPTETPILGDFEKSMGAELLDGVRNFVGRHGRVEDVAAVIGFLSSPAAGWVNGQDIQVDGGFLAAMSVGTSFVAP